MWAEVDVGATDEIGAEQVECRTSVETRGGIEVVLGVRMSLLERGFVA